MRRAAFLATRATRDDRDDASLSSDSDDSLGGIHDPTQMPRPDNVIMAHSDDDDSDTDPHPIPAESPLDHSEQPLLSDTESEHTDNRSDPDNTAPPCTMRRSSRLRAGNRNYASEMPGD